MSMLEVPVSGGKYKAKIDDQDWELVSAYRWYLRRGRTGVLYAARDTSIKGLTWNFMHGLIMGFNGIDHINHDGLDNRRVNLRDGRGGINRVNSRWTKIGASSEYRGVNLHEHGAWQATISINGKKKYLGQFMSEEIAARVYDKAAWELYGTVATLNFPEEDLLTDEEIAQESGKYHGEYPGLADREWLVDQYVTQQKALTQIASELGCSNHLVEYRLDQFSIPTRSRADRVFKSKKCERCSKDFRPKGPASRFCSEECKQGITALIF